MSRDRILDFDPARGIPAGARIVYSCDECGDRIASMPAHEAECACGNISVDFGRRAREDRALRPDAGDRARVSG
jgi:hypothetical protein